MYYKIFALIFFALPAFAFQNGGKQRQPNIILILADDLGFNDVSWRNEDIISPNLEALVKSGTILDNAYVQPTCTPTRSALMTGYYPIHTGRQTGVLGSQEPAGLFTNFTLLPQRLKSLGYQTHAAGKWHLGYCSKDYLPTRRGFDTFRGFYLGSQNYYKHTRKSSGGTVGYDFRNREEVDGAANNTYSAYLIVEEAERVIENHAKTYHTDSSDDKPMFLYLPFQHVHNPVQVPDKYSKMYPNIKNHARRTYSGMVTVLDESVGRVVESLKANGLYENSVIVFMSDNGGKTSAGNNLPLRGGKGTLWEGGTRVVAFINAPFIQGSTYRGLFHVTDWLPTLYEMAGGNVEDLGKIDGVSQFKSLVQFEEGKLNQFPRNNFLYNIDPHDDKNAGLRIGDMKLLVGNPGKPSGRIPIPTKETKEMTRDEEFGRKKKVNEGL